MSDLIETLRLKGREIEFFQAVTLLEEYFGDKNHPHNSEIRDMKFSANPDITFPSSDIYQVKTHPGWGVEFLLSFMGLLGISSPLPHYFTDYGAKHANEPCALTDFLNIFDHRIYTLFYRAWKKYRPIPVYSHADQLDLYKRTAALAGLNLECNESGVENEMLAYAGLLAGASRNADSLAEILTDCLEGVVVSVEEFVVRWAKVENSGALGSNIVLGEEALLGESVFDRSGKVRIIIDIKEAEAFERFLPDSENIKKVAKIVHLFSPQPLEFDVVVRFCAANLIPMVLGRDSSRLGISASCGENHDSGAFYSITVPGKN